MLALNDEELLKLFITGGVICPGKVQISSYTVSKVTRTMEFLMEKDRFRVEVGSECASIVYTMEEFDSMHLHCESRFISVSSICDEVVPESICIYDFTVGTYQLVQEIDIEICDKLTSRCLEFLVKAAVRFYEKSRHFVLECSEIDSFIKDCVS